MRLLIGHMGERIGTSGFPPCDAQESYSTPLVYNIFTGKKKLLCPFIKLFPSSLNHSQSKRPLFTAHKTLLKNVLHIITWYSILNSCSIKLSLRSSQLSSKAVRMGSLEESAIREGLARALYALILLRECRSESSSLDVTHS